MSDVEYLCKFLQVNSSNGARPMLLGPDEAKQRHHHWNSSSLQGGVSTAWLPSIQRYLMPQAVKIRWCQRNLEKIQNISSSAIENANRWRQLRTVRLEFLYKFLPVNCSNGAKQGSFFGAMQTLQRHQDWKFILTTMRCFNDLTAFYPKISDRSNANILPVSLRVKCLGWIWCLEFRV